ncbi:MAG: ribose-5-phosphate isomerase A, partial [Planctomycetota bacterium]
MGESPLVASDGLAERALEGVTQGMKIGFGAGRTPARAIDLLGVRATAGLDVAVVAASESAEARCRAAGLTVLDFATVEELDLLVDGVDEIDRDMRALKGSGGAMARERIIAWASRRTIYMAGA